MQILCSSYSHIWWWWWGRGFMVLNFYFKISLSKLRSLPRFCNQDSLVIRDLNFFLITNHNSNSISAYLMNEWILIVLTYSILQLFYVGWNNTKLWPPIFFFSYLYPCRYKMDLTGPFKKKIIISNITEMINIWGDLWCKTCGSILMLKYMECMVTSYKGFGYEEQ